QGTRPNHKSSRLRGAGGEKSSRERVFRTLCRGCLPERVLNAFLTERRSSAAGRGEKQNAVKKRYAGPVCCSGLILMMVSLGMGRGLSQGYTGSKPRSFCPSVGFSGRV